MPDVVNLNDERLYRYLRFKAEQKRRTATNGATRAAAERDAARRAAVLELARRQFGTRGPEGE